jgi:hypothetical protein
VAIVPIRSRGVSGCIGSLGSHEAQKREIVARTKEESIRARGSKAAISH